MFTRPARLASNRAICVPLDPHPPDISVCNIDEMPTIVSVHRKTNINMDFNFATGSYAAPTAVARRRSKVRSPPRFHPRPQKPGERSVPSQKAYHLDATISMGCNIQAKALLSPH
jgi:hypothetical protein